MKRLPRLAFALGPVLAALLVGCPPDTSTTGGTSPSASPTSAVSPNDVVYKVTGTACAADLTYQTASGDTAQLSAQPLPWTLDLGNVSPGSFVYVSAQISSTCGPGDVTATIDVGGAQFKTATSSGSYVIATADGDTGQ